MGDRIYRLHREKRSSLPSGRLQPCLFLVLSLFLCGRGEADALTLLAIRDFGQAVGASYHLQRSSFSGESGSRRNEEFTEDYSTGFTYYLLAPELLKGNTMLDLEWLQNSEKERGESADASRFSLRYNVNGSLLSTLPTPVNFNASSTRETVSLPYSPNYQAEQDSLSTSLTLLNDYVPANFSVSRQSQKTSGLNQDLTQKSHGFSAHANPKLGEMGSLEMGLNLNQSDSSGADLDSASHNTSASANLGYHAGWRSPQNLARNFSLVYGYMQNKGTSVTDAQNLSSSIGWQFGKVLDSNLSFFSSKSSSPEQRSESRGFSGGVKHKLMGSLTTHADVNLMQSEFEGGQNNTVGGGAHVSYHKTLPSASSLSAGYGYHLSRNERTGQVASVYVQDERQVIPLVMPRRITLNQPTFQPETLKVVGAQSQLTYPSSFYIAVPGGIELIDYNGLDTEVLVSYRYAQDPSLTTLGTSQSLTTTLSLLGGKYRIYGNARFNDQRVVKGEATSLTLSGTRHYDVGGAANLQRHTLAAELGYDKEYVQDIYYLTSSWGYTTPYGRGDLSINANDRYTLERLEGGQEMWVNSFSVQSVYRRPFGRFAAKFRANYANMLSQQSSYNAAVVGANLEAHFGKLFVLLNTSASMTFSAGGNSSSESVGIALRRSF